MCSVHYKQEEPIAPKIYVERSCRFWNSVEISEQWHGIADVRDLHGFICKLQLDKVYKKRMLFLYFFLFLHL